MKKKSIYVFSILLLSFAILSFTTRKPVINHHVINHSVTPDFNPHSYFEKQCSFCHNEKGKIGPPMSYVKKMYLKKYPKAGDFIEKMTDFILNPNAKTRLIKDNIGKYDVMPNGMFTDKKKITQVVKYIYENIKIPELKEKNISANKKPSENKTQKAILVIEVHKGQKINDLLHLQKIYFKNNSYLLNEKLYNELDKIAVFLKNNKNIKLEIRNYTDSRGNAKKNLEITNKRAQAVKNYLVGKGIEPNRLKTKGFGETKIINRCVNGVKCSEKEHLQNRRTEFIIL
jgi:outer membrane protein OmpA-like peptidoglycan-associated protein